MLKENLMICCMWRCLFCYFSWTFNATSFSFLPSFLPTLHFTRLTFDHTHHFESHSLIVASPLPALSDAMCRTNAQADIVLLVDGSWSIGRLNFKTIRAFIARMVGVFDIGPDRVQIGALNRNTQK